MSNPTGTTRKRIVRRVVLCLLLGAILNMVVAQAIGWFVRTPYKEPTYLFVGDSKWAAEVRDYRRFGRREFQWRAMEEWAVAIWRNIRLKKEFPEGTPLDAVSVIPSWCSVHAPGWRAQWVETAEKAGADGNGWFLPEDVAIGWPFLSFSLSTEARSASVDPRLDPPRVTRGGMIQESGRGSGYRRSVLAWNPILPGVALGSTFWASVLLTMVLATGATRRVLRRRNGRCPHCGYDVQSHYSAPCPECGTISRKVPAKSNT